MSTARDLDARAQRVGAQLGPRLRFRVAPGGLFTGLTMCRPHSETVVCDYSAYGDAAAHAAHWDLDRLESGQYLIHEGQTGEAVLIRFLSADEIIARADGQQQS